MTVTVASKTTKNWSGALVLTGLGRLMLIAIPGCCGSWALAPFASIHACALQSVTLLQPGSVSLESADLQISEVRRTIRRASHDAADCCRRCAISPHWQQLCGWHTVSLVQPYWLAYLAGRQLDLRGSCIRPLILVGSTRPMVHQRIAGRQVIFDKRKIKPIVLQIHEICGGSENVMS